MKKVLLIGWDAADWKVIKPLLDAGRMPNLSRLISEGSHGNLATIYPVLSPLLWTSIATGKRAYKHGIHGFTEPMPNGSGVRPITVLSRKTKAVWNILNQTGHRSVVVGWWPSHPAEPINGVMVSNHFPQPVGKPGDMPLFVPGVVHPATLAESLGELRVNPMELNGDFLRLFVPDYQKVDQAADKRLHSLGKIIAETMSIHSAATELLANEVWDFAAVYYSAIDHFGHAFMRYHPPRLPWVTDDDFQIYQNVIANAYRYHDAMLGTLLEFTDENTTVILMSDHGFHPDHLRPGYIPVEPAGPAVEHRHFGIICLKGPAIRAREELYGASLLDVCPTILSLFGLQPGKDMDGKVLVTAFRESPKIEPIESWDDVAGEAGTHPPDTRIDPVSSAQAFKQLVELGYVAPPGNDTKEAIDESVRELKYNLARSYQDGNCCGEAAALAEELWNRWPNEHRFGILLVDCLGALRQVSRRRTVIEELGRRIQQCQAEAEVELAKPERERENRGEVAAGQPTKTQAEFRVRFEERRLRELAHGRPLLIEWLLVSQALLEKRPDEARRCLEKLTAADHSSDVLSERIASALAELGDLDGARVLLEEVLQSDRENPIVYSQLAAIYFEAGRFNETISAATESLSLLYFQPGIHALMGQALMETKRFPEAERELLVAVSQSPRHLKAHELLGRLYRQHLDRPADAFAHEGRALSLRNELAARGRTSERRSVGASERTIAHAPTDSSAPFGSEVKPTQIITIVSGLPRSGTSMMMQILAAAGREALTDGQRPADEDNPLGYFELEKARDLARDVSWLPQARGKVVKIVAQLLPNLPRDEHYQIIFMERDLAEVIASQSVMLARLGRRGAEMTEQHLMATYAEQLERSRAQLARRSEIRTLSVSYSELLAHPHEGVNRVANFIGEPFDREAAVRAVHPDLQRQKV